MADTSVLGREPGNRGAHILLKSWQEAHGIFECFQGFSAGPFFWMERGAVGQEALPDGVVGVAGLMAKLRAILDLAERLTLKPAGMLQIDGVAATGAGWSVQPVEDGIDLVSLFGLLNHLVDGFVLRGSDRLFRIVGGMTAQRGCGSLIRMVQEETEGIREG